MARIDGETGPERGEQPFVLRALRNAAQQLLQHDPGKPDLLVAPEERGHALGRRLLRLATRPPPEHRRNHAGVQQDHERRRAFL